MKCSASEYAWKLVNEENQQPPWKTNKQQQQQKKTGQAAGFLRNSFWVGEGK